MCIRNKQDVNKCRTPKTPRSPYKRHLSESMKLRLSRRVVPGARINLNSYWNKFEDLAKQNLPLVSFDIPSASDVTVNHLRQLEICPMDENILNELLELGNK